MGLSTSLAIATQSLLAQEAAIETTNNNIANANTPGYSRETIQLTESASVQQHGVNLGDGATLQGFTSVRDEVLNLRIQQQTSQQSSANAQSAALQQVQGLFPSTGASLSTDLTSFFTSLSSLSASPTSAAARQTVIGNAQDLVDQFHAVSNGLTSQQASLSTQVGSDVAQINTLSSQVAALNTQQAELVSQGQNTGQVQDQIGALETQLSKLTNISVVHTPGGDTLSTGTGTPLVVGGQSYALTTSTGAGGATQVLDGQGNNITSAISGGDLGGSIQARDTAIAGLLTQVDTLANQFATAFNAAQAQGFDENGTAASPGPPLVAATPGLPGTPLFTVPGTVAGSAAAIVLATTDPRLIAASSDGSSGSNGNIANLTAVETTTPHSGLSPANASANLIYQVGSLTSGAAAQVTGIGLSLAQLAQQQNSISGVSIDEESANLIRYQQAYQAAAQVINTVATLFTATINMLNGA